MQLPLTVKDYLQSLAEGRFPSLDDVALPCDDLLAKRMLALASSRFKEPISRSIKVRKIFARVTAIGYVKKLRLKFSLWQKERAYMRDGGLLSLSLPYVAKERGTALLKVLLHELAHLVLANLPEYPALLSLDRAYAKESGLDEERKQILSPIELCATLLSIRLLEEVLSIPSAKGWVKEGIQTQILREREKLAYALNKKQNL